MPNPNPKHKFKKGVVTNPHGAGAHNPVVKKIRKLSQDELEEVGSIVVFSNVDKLKEIIHNPESSALKVWMAMVVVKAIERGDMNTLGEFCNRLGLKQTEKLQIQASQKPRVVVSLPSNGREVKELTDNGDPDT